MGALLDAPTAPAVGASDGPFRKAELDWNASPGQAAAAKPIATTFLDADIYERMQSKARGAIKMGTTI